MEIWVEYFIRRGIPVVRPFEPFDKEVVPYGIVCRSPSVEDQVWTTFIERHQSIISNLNLHLDWPGPRIVYPTLREQQEILFGTSPLLELLWERWLDNPTSFSLACSSRNVPIVRRV